MPLSTSQVAIIADPDFASRILTVARTMPTWVAETPQNRLAVEAIWKQNGRDGAAMTTLFSIDPHESPDRWAACMIGAVDEHHGVFSEHPPVDTLVIHGATLTEDLAAELAQHGYTELRADSKVIHARKESAI